MTADIKAIGPQGLTPAVVLDSVAKKLGEIEDVFLVVFPKKGEPYIQASGDLKRICHAAVVLEEMAHSFVRGDIES